MYVLWRFVFVAVAAALAAQLIRALGKRRGSIVAAAGLALLAGNWWLLERLHPTDAAPEDWSQVASVPATACAKCHADHYESWRRTYHRTMTREATSENVKGDFNDAVYDYQGLVTHLRRDGDRFIMDTIDPGWALARAQVNDPDTMPPPRRVQLSVDRLVGSHWIQECLHKDATGRYRRLPVLYHIAEKRWVHTSGAFLTPDSPDFWALARHTVWNDTCLYCHNTGPSKNPVVDRAGRIVEYRTEVAELGISCEACHGPGAEHVRLNRNPARRLALQESGAGDPSIVHPERLTVQRRDEICARCHGALVPKPEAWDARTHRDPFIAGQELTRFNHFFWSEAEQARLAGEPRQGIGAAGTEPIDGRFWGDGTPLTTALEYNAMALSACYEQGQGTLSCLSCHTMHGDDPNFLLKPGMSSNRACYQCHPGYRAKLTEHTHHPANSPGSLCYNCHMPHVVYSLLATHRSHRIENPSVATTVATGKPHACNLCHLDKSLGWTQAQLARWQGVGASDVKLSPDQETISAALVTLAQADARSRAMVAGAFSNSDAQQTAGADWMGPVLTRLLEVERYPAVRYLLHRGLRMAHGVRGSAGYDYLAEPKTRAVQLHSLRRMFDAMPVRREIPGIPLTPDGFVDDAVLRRLLSQRHDPDLTINE
jgi:predicted CXXCH cytochrome family protein